MLPHYHTCQLQARIKIGQLPPKKGKVKLQVCCGNGEWVFSIYSELVVTEVVDYLLDVGTYNALVPYVLARLF